MSYDVTTLLKTGAIATDEALERLLPSGTTEPHSIHRAMRHSTFAGGKRLRPILCMEAARCVAGGLPPGAADLGAALEMVHTYSLIHDDLPALDNDDLRRGQPTCHVVFGEAIAILAGDALQTLAFQTLAQLPAPAATVVEIIREFSSAIGTGVGPVPGSDVPQVLPAGMIGGQVMDIEGEGQTPTAELVERIHRSKTGALITTSIVCGGLLGIGTLLGPEPSSIGSGSGFPHEIKARIDARNLARDRHADLIASLRIFGEKAGLAFQIVDDILDVTQSSEQLGKTAGKDTAAIKATWPAVYGLETSKRDAAQLIADAFAAVEPFGDAATPLKSLAQYLVERTY
jgi:geranylgeranyl diphosphate synthase type II